MKIKIPDELKADVPQTIWGKILSATPVVMTVIATLLAGLASSEMTRAQYDRSLAAQQQSKAGDQWSYFQAKRLRGALQRNTLDILQATIDVQPLATARLPAPASESVLAALQKGELPVVPAAAALDANVKAALEAIESQKPETEIATQLGTVEEKTLAEALAAAKGHATVFDAATKPINQTIDQMEKSLVGGDKSLTRDFTVARLRYTAARYDAEARLNQTIANLLELQVRKNNISAERHHERSGRFFYGMLGAQAGVIIATFAIAARKRNLLWSLAAAAGAAAVSFAVYVYWFV
ncbi:MAG: DUF4337 domain-containing protein [Verrucomicrobia bacterium]|jgi:hypothetical protein|nr:DUF4337 domain-containing protein [Verrucomicrobiota bacterium]